MSGAKDRFERHSFVGALSKKIHPKGLTLVEVLATAAIVGMFAGLISPVFFGLRDRSEARSKTAEAVGIAKECATLKIDLSRGSEVFDPKSQSMLVCDQFGFTEIASKTWLENQSVNCMGSEVLGTGVVLNVSPQGSIQCSSVSDAEGQGQLVDGSSNGEESDSTTEFSATATATATTEAGATALASAIATAIASAMALVIAAGLPASGAMLASIIQFYNDLF